MIDIDNITDGLYIKKNNFFNNIIIMGCSDPKKRNIVNLNVMILIKNVNFGKD